MVPFDQLYEVAAARKGGAKALEELLPTPKAAKELAAISDDRWLAEISKRVFQAGFNWSVVENKWPGFETAFWAFDPVRCARMSEADLDNLLTDKGIVRNGTKIVSVRENGKFLCELAAEHGSASDGIAAWPSEDIIGLLQLFKKRASRLGGRTAQIVLRAMGKDTFLISGDVSTALVREGVVTKAPTSQRDMKAVQEAFNAWCAESGRPLCQVSRVLAMTIDREIPGRYIAM